MLFSLNQINLNLLLKFLIMIETLLPMHQNENSSSFYVLGDFLANFIQSKSKRIKLFKLLVIYKSFDQFFNYTELFSLSKLFTKVLMHQAQLGNQSFNKEDSCSPSRETFIIKKIQKRSCKPLALKDETFSQSKNTNLLSYQSTLKKEEHRKAQQDVLKESNSAFKNIQTIRKVATFLQNAKMRVIREIPKLQPLEAFYLQNQEIQQQQKDKLISWNNRLLIGFETVLMVTIFVGIWLSTYQLILGRIQNGYIIMTVLLIFHITSIVLTFNTELKTQKLEIISTRIQIFWIFLKEDCIYESITVISLVFQLASIEIFFYPERILLLISIHTALKIFKKIQDNFAVTTEIQSVIGIVQLAFKIFTFVHFLALFLNGMSKIQNSDQTWIQSNGLQDSSPFELYIHGYYWASTVMSTVGFGDITPGNVFQRAVMSFIQVFCCLFFGYCVNVIGKMIGVLGQSKMIFENDMRKLNKYLQSTKIPDAVKDKVKEHFYNKHKIQQIYDKQSEQYLFNKMTQSLQSEVMHANSISVVQKSKFLKIFSTQSKKKIAKKIVKRVYAPQETLFNKDSQNIKLFLIQQGKIDEFCFNLAHNSFMKNKIIAKYDEEDNTVGWGNLITGYKYKSCTRANNYTILYEIDQADFISIIRENPRDFIKFHEIRQKILQKEISFKKSCFVCERLTHSVVKCPKIHFIPKSMSILVSFLKNQLKLLHHKRSLTYVRSKKKRNLFIQQYDFSQTNSQESLQRGQKDYEKKSNDSQSQNKKPNPSQKKQYRKSIDLILQKLNKGSNQTSMSSLKSIKKRQRISSVIQPIVSTVFYSQQITSQSAIGARSKNLRLQFQQKHQYIAIDAVMLELDPNFFQQYSITSLIQKLQKSKIDDNYFSISDDRRKVLASLCYSAYKTKNFSFGTIVRKQKSLNYIDLY